MEIRRVNKSQINPAPYNPRKDLQPGDPEYDKLARSIETFGDVEPLVWNERSGNLVGGHQRLKILLNQGREEFDVSVVDLDDIQEKQLNLALNKISGDWDNDKLTALLDEIAEMADVTLTGFDWDEINQTIEELAATAATQATFRDKLNNEHGTIVNTFLVPPFSVLDTRQGYWQERKAKWIELGIASEVGRGKNLTYAESLRMGNKDDGTSVFDPVLCETMYHWFNTPNGTIFDPFAGGSVRGIVANVKRHPYCGIELRKEQVDSNYQNAKDIGIDIDGDIPLRWICDDSVNMEKYIDKESVDMVFSCPPYFDLEVYSDLDNDLSNMTFDEFYKTYTEILQKAAMTLKQNRFAVVVISDVRDKKGCYHNLMGLTVEAMCAAGLHFYNEMVLLNVAGSAAVRCRKNMRNRKVVRVHQNVLVFFKGDTTRIAERFPELTEINEDDLNNLLEKQ